MTHNLVFRKDTSLTDFELLKKRPVYTHTVEAKDFTYQAGEWKKSSGGIDPAALVLSNPLVETTASVTLLSPQTVKTLAVSFSLRRNAEQSGWEDADLSIWAKVGNSERQTQSINKELLSQEPGERKVYSRTFNFDDAGKNLTFGLFDGTTKQTTSGLDLYFGQVGEMN